MRTNPSSSAVSLLNGNTIAYNLCGIGGKNCAIGIGTPSSARLLLLRREALELALYTFKYVHGVENVVAILPPGPLGSRPATPDQEPAHHEHGLQQAGRHRRAVRAPGAGSPCSASR